MVNIVYKIKDVYDKDGNKKEIDDLMKIKHYLIYFAKVGRSAILLDVFSDYTVNTSTVDEIYLWENGVKISTKNTVYHLEPMVRKYE